jgi:hypothetical protein
MLERMVTAAIPDVAKPVEQCCYCWHRLHGEKPYPEQWSSTICNAHSHWLVQRLAEQRAMRLHHLQHVIQS